MLPLLVFSLEEGIRPWFIRRILVGVGKTNSEIIHQLSTHSSPQVACEVKAALRELEEEPPELVTDRVISVIGRVWPPHPALRALCLGDFRVYQGEEEITSWRTTKSRDLLAYFITSRDRRLSLDQVLEAIWPEVDPASGNALFHTNLYNLRQALKTKADNSKYILGTGGLYWLDREALWVDVDEFERAASILASGDKLDDDGLSARIELYRGDYLQNLYYGWCLPEQERLRRLYFKALRVLATHFAQKGNYLQAIDHCQRMLSLDPLQEEVHCQVMGYYAHLGDQSSLVRQYQLLEKTLKQELDIEPGKETRKIYHHLLSTYFS
jgi:two-component SAPR family response regulator